jgi:hypothetical protein
LFSEQEDDDDFYDAVDDNDDKSEGPESGIHRSVIYVFFMNSLVCSV